MYYIYDIEPEFRLVSSSKTIIWAEIPVRYYVFADVGCSWMQKNFTGHWTTLEEWEIPKELKLLALLVR